MAQAIPDKSIDMCMTSPPYWRLKNYEIQGQYGIEKTHEEYIKKMAAVFSEIKRTLKKEGTLWLNMGDTYSGSGKGSGDDKPDPKFKGGGRERTLKADRDNSLPSKCLCMIPERLAWSLIQDGWILRNKIIWHKSNGMPSSVKDRLTNKWEHLFLFSKSRQYYFDLDSIREPHKKSSIERYKTGYKGTRDRKHLYDKKDNLDRFMNNPESKIKAIENGKNPGDLWSIPTQPFSGAHFAVFPESLCEKPIKAGCPEDGTILDPFCGIGTTCYVAKEMGRNYIGIDIKKEYVEMSKKRNSQGTLQNNDC